MSPELKVAPLAGLRRRTSVKWRNFADDVLSLFVAEMDFDLAPRDSRAGGGAGR